MEIENEHLAEVAHLGVLCVRRKGGEVFGLDAVALDGEGIHQDRKSTRLNSSHIQKSRMPSSA